MVTVSTARRASAAAPGAKGSPLEPRFGQRGTGWQFQVDLGLAAVSRRHEAGREQRHQQNGADEEGAAGQRRDVAVRQAPAHQADVAQHDPAILFGAVNAGFQQVGRHHRRQQPRHHQ
jgi:hypothetical protein